MRQLDECLSVADEPPPADEPPLDSASEAVAAPPDNQAPAAAPAPAAAAVSSEPTRQRPPSCGGRLLHVTLQMQLGGVLLTEEDVVHCSLLPYLCSLAWLLEGRTIDRHELVAALLKRMRQRSIGRLPYRAYVRSYCKQHPP